MAATIDQIQAGIAASLFHIPGLFASAHEPEQPNLPVAYPRLVDWTYDDQFGEFGGDTATVYHFDIWVLVKIPTFNRGQTMLNPFLSPRGSSSIKVAIEQDPSLGGIVDSCRVTGGGSYGKATIAELTCLAASVRLEVFA
jgi:hypothetical protein